MIKHVSEFIIVALCVTLVAPFIRMSGEFVQRMNTQSHHYSEYISIGEDQLNEGTILTNDDIVALLSKNSNIEIQVAPSWSGSYGVATFNSSTSAYDILHRYDNLTAFRLVGIDETSGGKHMIKLKALEE